MQGQCQLANHLILLELFEIEGTKARADRQKCDSSMAKNAA
jgi:hypothetical protein